MPQKLNNLKIWNHSNRKLFLGISGFLFGVFGILCGMFWEHIFNWILEKEMVLRPDSRLYENWKTPPLALNLDVYLFNWTNSEDFRNLSTKPILQQVGPYRFAEKPDKVDISWHPENASVTYRRKSFFYFDPAGSTGSLHDKIITVNAVALSAAAKAKQWNPVRRRMVDVGLKLYGQTISVMKTVDELLFTGYSDDMIDMARAMPIFGSDVEVPFDRFGWFYTRNGSADLTGVFNVYTGADDITRIGQMHSWNYMTHTGFFDSYCGQTNGSAGEFQPPNLRINGTVHLFSPDMCRSLPLDYVESVEIEGVPGYKYAGGRRSVDNGTVYAENSCFCGGNCVASGVMNISSCRFGSPVFMSYPHFFNADPVYVNQVVGLHPSKDDHEFYMILEPKTGAALQVAARFQVNMLLEPIPHIRLYENIPRIFFPLIWFEQKVQISPQLAAELKSVSTILLGGQIFAGICFAIGLVLLCWYPIELLLWGRQSQKFKSQHAENGNYKATPTDQAKGELSPLKSAEVAEPEKPLDRSLLLGKSSSAPKIIPKSRAEDSVAAATTKPSNSTSL